MTNTHIKKASLMYVHSDCFDEYKKRHDEIWPELVEVLKKHGAQNYSIYLDEVRGLLFAYVEIESEERWAQVAKTEVCQKWWAYMKPLMETNEDNSPVSTELKNVFYMA
ncbi:L-rhamnose mutarotase [Vibrio maritimus]|uniref:L-rhamnose mutarotase n=1 Tax=Vibrio maritimus TaxID=990268 RepID=UPI0037360C95